MNQSLSQTNTTNNTYVTPRLFKEILLAIQDKFASIFKGCMKKDIKDVSEQTVLAAVVILLEEERQFQIISMASGTKSVGKKNLTLNGNLISDSHAEVLARRAFKRYLCDHLNDEKYFAKDKEGLYSKKNFKTVFYSSQSYCGQSSIQQHCSNTVLTEDIGGSTGAKYYEFIFDDVYNPEKDILQNQLRVKPGRSDLPQDSRSISLSCSDKLMIWNILGVQGSLLSQVIREPIYFDYLLIENDRNNQIGFKECIKQGILLEKRLQSKITNQQLREQLFLRNNKQDEQGKEANQCSQIRDHNLTQLKENQENFGIIEDKTIVQEANNSESNRLLIPESNDKYDRNIKLNKFIKKEKQKTIYYNNRFTLHKPRVIATRKIFFLLNRNLVDRKPKYLDQHIIYLHSLLIGNQMKSDVVELLNGSTGLKWGMGSKGASIPKNFPIISKYNFFIQFKEITKNYSQLYNSNFLDQKGDDQNINNPVPINTENIKRSQANQETQLKLGSYYEYKMKAQDYYALKNRVLDLFQMKLIEKCEYDCF